jgi:hypothetical protein
VLAAFAGELDPDLLNDVELRIFEVLLSAYLSVPSPKSEALASRMREEAIWPFTRYPAQASRVTRNSTLTSSCARMDALRQSNCLPSFRRQRKVIDIAC